MLGNKSKSKFYRTGGTRGGQNQFQWENVKTDRDRENYLGNSVNAAVGRWQRGRDIFWYTKSKEDVTSMLEEEREKLRQTDDLLMNEKLGFKPKRKLEQNSSMDAQELKQFLAKGSSERCELDAGRVVGLGAAPTRGHDHIEKGLTMIEKQIQNLKNGISESNASESINRLESSTHIEQKRAKVYSTESDSSSEDVKKSKSKKEKHKKEKHKKEKHKKEKHKKEKHEPNEHSK